LVGEDGPTHHGVFDLAYMRAIPNIIVSAPMDESDLRNLMYTAQLGEHKLPFSIRYPRGCGINSDWKKPFEKIEIGKGRKLSDGKEIALLTIGRTGFYAEQAVARLSEKNISVAHFDMRFVKPLDTDLLTGVFKNFNNIITVEDGTIRGGFGSAILEFMAENKFASNVKLLGVPDEFIEHGTLADLHKDCGIDTEGIINSVMEMLKK
jgi:1-deoxy-D-xylulose-5-phosphate synthase